MYDAFFVTDHTTHFYALSGPDVILGPDAPVAERNILGVIRKVGLRARRPGHRDAPRRPPRDRDHRRPARPPLHRRAGRHDQADQRRRARRDRSDRHARCSTLRPRACTLFDKFVTDDPPRGSSYSATCSGTRRTTPDSSTSDGKVALLDGRDQRGRPRRRIARHATTPPTTATGSPSTSSRGRTSSSRTSSRSAGRASSTARHSGIYCVGPLGRLERRDGHGHAARPGGITSATSHTLAPAAGSRRRARPPARREPLGAPDRDALRGRADDRAGQRPGDHLAPTYARYPTQTPTEGVGTVEAPRGTLTHHYWTDERGIVTRGQPDRRHDQQPRSDRDVDRQAARGLIQQRSRRRRRSARPDRDGLPRLRPMLRLRDAQPARPDAARGRPFAAPKGRRSMSFAATDDRVPRRSSSAWAIRSWAMTASAGASPTGSRARLARTRSGEASVRSRSTGWRSAA